MGKPPTVPLTVYHINYALYIEMGEEIEHGLSINRRHFAWCGAGRIHEQLDHRNLYHNWYVRCL